VADAPTAILDAAVIHGAYRYLAGLHDKDDWPYRATYNKADDRDLFFDFLHDILLYDRILLDDSCGHHPASAEVIWLMEQINTSQHDEIMTREELVNFSSSDLGSVMSGICRMVKALPDRSAIIPLAAPWGYRSNVHVDYNAMKDYAAERGLNEDAVPFALYCYRGFCYSSIARGHSASRHIPTVYLASPGRLTALQRIVSSDVIEENDYLRRGYVELLEVLDLPSNGFQFTDFSGRLLGHDISPLTTAYFNMAPANAFAEVLKLRTSSEARELRLEWGERLLDQATSCAVGLKASQVVSNSTIGGDVNMYLYASLSQKPRRVDMGKRQTRPASRRDGRSSSRQDVSEVKVGGDAKLSSDAERSEQAVSKSSIKQNLSMEHESRHPRLRIGGSSAVGTVAVVGLAAVAVAGLVVQFLLR
jgi:hypothetical protein